MYPRYTREHNAKARQDRADDAAKRITRETFVWFEQVAFDRELPELASAVAIAVSHFTNRKTGNAWPTQRTLATMLGISDRAVRRNLAALVERGHLAVTPGGYKEANTYRPVLKTTSDKQDASVLSEGDKEDASVRSGRTLASCLGGRQRPPEQLNEQLKEQLREESLPDQLDLLDDESPKPKPQTQPSRSSRKNLPSLSRFPEFWSVYPRKIDKQDAAAAFDRAVGSGADVDELIAGAVRYASARAGQDAKFTKHAATWLNKKCWLNGYDEQPPTPYPSGSYMDGMLRGFARVVANLDDEVLQ